MALRQLGGPAKMLMGWILAPANHGAATVVTREGHGYATTGSA